MVRSDLRSASRDRPKERAKASILAALRVAVGRQVLLQRVLASIFHEAMWCERLGLVCLRLQD